MCKRIMEGIYKICAPTDAISDDLGEAAGLLRELGLTSCELRRVDGEGLLSLPADRWKGVRSLLSQDGLEVAMLDSSIGKVDIADDFRPQLEGMKRVLELATSLKAPYVRAYSFLLPWDELDRWRGEVIDRFVQLAEVAGASRVKLLVENLPGSYCHSGRRLGDLVTAVGSPSLGVIFNPASFAARKEHPFLTAFKPGPVKNHILCLRISDALFEDGRAVLPNEGNAELKELISALLCRNFDGFFSLDPGLDPTPSNFRAAYQGFQMIMDSLGASCCWPPWST